MKQKKIFGKSKIGVQIQGFKKHRIVNGALKPKSFLRTLIDWIVN